MMIKPVDEFNAFASCVQDQKPWLILPVAGASKTKRATIAH